MRKILIVAALIIPGIAVAAGRDTPETPKPTPTTKTCKGIKIWDAKKGRCVRPKQSSLDQDQLFDAIRELAYAGRYEDAQGVLADMHNQQDDRVLTYWGFTHRKLGNAEIANSFYKQAIARNPDNLLARSYMGQGFVSEGKMELAIAQWREINARGGAGGWPETSLRNALETGLTFSY